MRLAPVLVIAPPGPEAPRLAAMLGQHPQIQDLPELNAFLAPTLHDLLELQAVADISIIDGLLRAIAALHLGGQTDRGIAEALVWLRRRADWTGAQLLDAFAQSLAPKLLVSPETGAGWRPHQLVAMLESCPDVRLLHLIEHPRPFCRARAAELAEQLFIAPDFKDYAVNPPEIDPQPAWHRVHTNITRIAEALPPSQFIALRIEDLRSAPELQLARICSWAGVPATPEQLTAMQFPERSVFAGYGPQAALHGAHQAFLDAPGFMRRLPSRESLVGPIEWRSGGRTLAADVVDLAQQFGYR